jgi:hypothetical protein
MPKKAQFTHELVKETTIKYFLLIALKKIKFKCERYMSHVGAKFVQCINQKL